MSLIFLFILSDEQWHGAGKNIVDKMGVTPRYLFQTLATDYCKGVGHPNLFVRYLATRILLCHADYAIIDDVRYLNELDYIKVKVEKLFTSRRR